MENRNKFPLITERNSSINVCSQGMLWDWGCGNEHEQKDTCSENIL